jgi:hypothetical protein
MLVCAAPAWAQGETHWGIAGSFVPQWEFLHFLEDSMERDVEMRGSDLRVGIIRGRQLGGEWGASFVRRRVDDGSIVVQQESLKCVAQAGPADVCARGTFHRTQGASMTGIQFHRFFPLGTIARRVQVGAVFTGGVARLRGDAEEVKEHLQVTQNAVTGQTSVSVANETTMVAARHVFDDTGIAEIVPVGGVEAAVAVLVGPSVKLRFSGGASFPGFHTFSMTAQYLFGSR